MQLPNSFVVVNCVRLSVSLGLTLYLRLTTSKKKGDLCLKCQTFVAILSNLGLAQVY